MPRPGGEADKLGNYYEMLWVADAALDLIVGEFTDLVVEPIGDEAAGIEFYRTDQTGTQEYHSIKRQQTNGNWTIKRLVRGNSPAGRSILGDLVRKVQEGARGVFSSGTSASELARLISDAHRSDSPQEFQELISTNKKIADLFIDRIVPVCGDDATAYAVLQRLDVRTKSEPDLTRDVERRADAMFRTRSGRPTDPTAVRVLIAECVMGKLGMRLTADSFLEYLEQHDYMPSQFGGGTTTNQRIKQLKRLYLNDVERLLINHTAIHRQESVTAYTTLLEKGKSVILDGMAGSGKSCVLAQVLDRLTASDVPCLVLSLDRLTEDDYSARAVGTRQGLPDSPVVTLGEVAAGCPSVLCVDQLDALSTISNRQSSTWGAFNELLDEASGYPNMRILFACRSFDLEEDANLRGLMADEGQVERISVGNLDLSVVESAIEKAGTPAVELTRNQLEILSTPLHLYLYLEVAGSVKFDFSSAGDLFDAFWKYKAERVDGRVQARNLGWTPTITVLCDAMSDREALTAPVYVLDDYNEATTAMASEAVIFHTPAENVQFFHDTFFDYCFARTFLRRNGKLVEWLASDKQHLFRRSQVRQVLAFLRDREPNRLRYLETLRELLGHPDIRFHLKKLVLDWLRALPDPTPDEWTIVEDLAGQLEGHAWGVVHNSVPWFDVLHDMGRWESWLASDGEQTDRAVRLLGAPDVFKTKSAVVAGLVGHFRGHSDEWRSRLQWLIKVGYGYTSPEMEDLALALIADGTLDDAQYEGVIGSDWWSIWYTPSITRPAFVSRVLGAWLDRQITRIGEVDGLNPLTGKTRLAPHSQTSEHVITHCADGAPREFVRELLPRFVCLDRRFSKEVVIAPSMLGSPDEQLREMLAQAMGSLAQSKPEELDVFTSTEDFNGSEWTSSILLLAWSANPDVYGERIARFILERPRQLLNIGYNFSIGHSDTFVAVSRTALAAASLSCTDESLAELERAILVFTPDGEQETEFEGHTRLALLRALAQERIAEASRQEIKRLETLFPNAQEYGAPEPPKQNPMAELVGPPIDEGTQINMSDDEWLSAMHEHASHGPTVREGQIVGGAVQLSRGLTVLVRKDPARFTALTNRMDETLPAVYFGAILEGLTNDEERSGRPGTLDQVSSVLRRVKELRIPIYGGDIARAVGSLADETLPQDIVQMLCGVALEDPDPSVDDQQSPDLERDPINHAINTARGAAAMELARLLSADTRRWEILKPTVERLVEDEVLSVRSVAVRCLLAILDSDRSDALTCFERLVADAEPILWTDFVELFIHYAMFRDYAALRPTLFGMANSSQPAVVRVGAKQIVVAALCIDEARGDEEIVLNMGEEARAGAAQIYASNLADEKVGAECETRLRWLFTDESDVVRQAASRCWAVLKPDEVASRGSLIGAFAESMYPSDDITVLAFRLQEAQRPLPDEVCSLAERVVEAYGPKAALIQYREAGAAYHLAPLLLRLHGQTSDSVLKERILNVIDDMIRAGFWGADEQLKQQFDR